MRTMRTGVEASHKTENQESNQCDRKHEHKVSQPLFQPVHPNSARPEQDFVEVEDPKRYGDGQ